MRKLEREERVFTAPTLDGGTVDKINSMTRRRALWGLLLVPIGMVGATVARSFAFRRIVGVAHAQAATPASAQHDGGMKSLTGAVQTQNGHLLTAVNGGGLGEPDSAPEGVALCTGAKTAGPRETFTIVWVDKAAGTFALKTHDNHFVSAVQGGGIGGPNDERAPVHTDTRFSGPWEKFRINVLADNMHVTIQTPDRQHFLCAVNGGGVGGASNQSIRTDASTLGAAETFRFIPGPESETNPENFYPRQAQPLFDPKTATANIVTKAAIDYLTKNAEIWQMEDPAKELRRRYAQPDWEVEFTQWNGGVRVFDAEVYVSFIRGAPFWVRSNYIPGLDSFDKSAKLSPAQAIEVARKHLASSVRAPLDTIRIVQNPVMGISTPSRVEPSRPLGLHYHLTLEANLRPVEYAIDAHTGTVVSEQEIRPQN
ncbi:MAG: PepSY domain-containing protein [Terracidiphilus sp.]